MDRIPLERSTLLRQQIASILGGGGPVPSAWKQRFLAAGGLSRRLREHQTSVLGVLLSGIKAHHMETTQARRDAGILCPHHSTHKETEVQRETKGFVQGGMEDQWQSQGLYLAW